MLDEGSEDAAHDYDHLVRVIALADKPAENAIWIGRMRVCGVKDPGVVVLPVDRRDVVPGNRPPVDLPGGNLRPALDAGKQALNPGAETMDYVARKCRVVFEARAVRLKNRHQIFGSGKDVDIRLLDIPILR